MTMIIASELHTDTITKPDLVTPFDFIAESGVPNTPPAGVEGATTFAGPVVVDSSGNLLAWDGTKYTYGKGITLKSYYYKAPYGTPIPRGTATEMRTVTFTPKSANSFINVTVRAQAHIDPNFGSAKYDGNMRLLIKLYKDGVAVADTRARNGGRNTGATRGNWTTVAAAFYQTASAGLPIVWKVTAITDGGGTNQYEMQNFDLLIEEVTL